MIIDANVIISILMDTTENKKSFTKGNLFQAPSLLKIELINVLRKYHYFKGLSKESTFKYYEQGISLIDKFYDDSTLLEKAIDISFHLNHPIYDCIYLSLAAQLKTEFLSIDKKLMMKAINIGIETIDFDTI